MGKDNQKLLKLDSKWQNAFINGFISVWFDNEAIQAIKTSLMPILDGVKSFER